MYSIDHGISFELTCFCLGLSMARLDLGFGDLHCFFSRPADHLMVTGGSQRLPGAERECDQAIHTSFKSLSALISHGGLGWFGFGCSRAVGPIILGHVQGNLCPGRGAFGWNLQPGSNCLQPACSTPGELSFKCLSAPGRVFQIMASAGNRAPTELACAPLYLRIAGRLSQLRRT